MGIGLLVVNVAIGSLIGGVTNELAIRMLFRPYKEWRIGGLRVPFTPGLIPRRRDEIGIQMGRMVEQYLLTPAGIRRAMEKSELENGLKSWLIRYARGQMKSELTGRELLSRYAPQLIQENGEWGEAVKGPLVLSLRSWTDRWIDGMADKPLRELLPPEGIDRLHEGIQTLSRTLLTRLAEHASSPEGKESIASLLRGVLAGGGGMLGGLVGMFLNEEKLLGMLMPHVQELLCKPELAEKLAVLMKREADRILDIPVRQARDWLGQEQIDRWRDQVIDRLLQASGRFLDKPLGELLAPVAPQITEEWIPRLCRWAVTTLEQNIERLFDRLPIGEIVARQVEGFPLERVEEMIIGISGKEFRMITILGFILGGIIGLVQGTLNLFW